MTHDYAKRSKTAQRPAARRNSKAAPPKRPLWPALMVIVLVAGLGYGLYQLAGVDPDPQETQQTLQQTATPVVKAKPKPKPVAKSDDGYKFYKLLPESEVVPAEVEAYRSTPKSEADYSNHLLQAGSFKRSSDADSLRAKLLLAGLPNVTATKATSSSGSIWYRVRVGPFPSRSKLNKAYDQMVRMNLQPLHIKL